MNKKILLIFIFAFLVRLIALNQSLWLDEAITAHVVKNLSFANIIRQFSPNDFHPPIYYLFMKLWTNIFGYSEVALRMPSVILSLLTGWVMCKICRLHQGFGEPLWSVVLFLFNPLIVYYSQEARMYMMVTFFLTTALYYFLKITQNKNKKTDVLFFGIFISLAFSTFYGSIFLVAAMLLYLLYIKQYFPFVLSLVILLFSFIIISPLLYTQWVNSKTALISVKNWSIVLGKSNLKNLLLIPVKFSIGRIDFYPKWAYYLISSVWTGFILYQLIKLKNNYLLKYLILSTLFFAFAISFAAPMLDYFRYIYLIPILAMLLSVFNKNFNSRYILAGGFIIFSLIYLLLPQFHREDWKGLAASINTRVPIYMILPSSDPMKYYRPDLALNELRSIGRSSKIVKQIVVIPYTSDIYGYDYEKILTNVGYRLTYKESFHDLTVEHYTSL